MDIASKMAWQGSQDATMNASLWTQHSRGGTSNGPEMEKHTQTIKTTFPAELEKGANAGGGKHLAPHNHARVYTLLEPNCMHARAA